MPRDRKPPRNNDESPRNNDQESGPHKGDPEGHCEMVGPQIPTVTGISTPPTPTRTTIKVIIDPDSIADFKSETIEQLVVKCSRKNGSQGSKEVPKIGELTPSSEDGPLVWCVTADFSSCGGTVDSIAVEFTVELFFPEGLVPGDKPLCCRLDELLKFGKIASNITPADWPRFKLPPLSG